MAAVDPTSDSTGKAVDAAIKSGTKVISLGEPIQASMLQFASGWSMYDVGMAQAMWLAGARSHGTIVVIKGTEPNPPGSPNEDSAQQATGVFHVLRPLFRAGAFHLGYQTWTPLWDALTAGQEMAYALRLLHNDVNGVIAPNDSMAAFIVRALRGNHVAGKVAVTGDHAQPDALGRILQRSQGMTLFEPLDRPAEWAARAAADLISNPHMVPAVFNTTVPTTSHSRAAAILEAPLTVTRKVVGFVVRHGGPSWDAICDTINKPVKYYCGLGT
jgi:D-xylose transport system substrate-binding protein